MEPRPLNGLSLPLTHRLIIVRMILFPFDIQHPVPGGRPRLPS